MMLFAYFLIVVVVAVVIAAIIFNAIKGLVKIALFAVLVIAVVILVSKITGWDSKEDVKADLEHSKNLLFGKQEVENSTGANITEDTVVLEPEVDDDEGSSLVSGDETA